MKLILRAIYLILVLIPMTIQAQDLDLTVQSTYATGIFDEGAAEIVAFDKATNRLYFTNADNNSIGVLDVSDPTNLSLITTIDLSTYGAGVNSCAVANGVLAVAVEADPVTDPGQVVLFSTSDNSIIGNPIMVGALPDMLTFTPDGNYIIVANEGEPNDDYTVDPEGSISVINISVDITSPTVSTVSFDGFNDKKASLENRGIRIFGPGASVAQDLEPEYITVTSDSRTALVALQENNALAVVDITAGTLLDILPLGYKDHATGQPTLTEYKLNELVDLPVLGTPEIDGVEQDPVVLSGFSGMWFDANESTETELVFYVIPDRGPNESTVSPSNVFSPFGDEPALTNLRPFKLPDYQARIAKFIINTQDGTASLDDQIFLSRESLNGNRIDTLPVSGRGNVISFDETPVRVSKIYPDSVTEFTNADFVDSVARIGYRELQFDAFGGDFEGILRDNDGDFWLCDEYRPAIYEVGVNGMVKNRFVPEGTSDLTIETLGFSFGPGFYGQETLPSVYKKRRANRGFEAIAYDADADIIYAFIQSPIETPDRATVRNNSDVIRILGINPTTGAAVSEYVYLLERNRDAGVGTRVDKIGDAVYIGNGRFLILERDSSLPGEDTGKKYVYEIDITYATNLRANPDFTEIANKETSSGADDKTLEMMTADDLAAAGIRTAFKRKIVNLPSLGYQPSDKAEGISLLTDGSIAVINDNDFGLAGAGVSDEISLGIISFGTNNAIDASNDDGAINFANYPALGAYQPDAITSFDHNGATFILSANEGDARDYDGYSEETRVGSLTLEPNIFTDAATLQMNANMGRLRTTNATGDLDGDGDFDRIYSYGARSFSVWDGVGNLVWDSGDEFERIIAERDPDNFNSNNDDNDSFDSRSDDKGPEPEAVEVATIGDNRYALIGLERVGGIMIYNINDPAQPTFVNYISNRNFSVAAESAEAGDLGIEDIVFIAGENSPTGEPLVVTANEVSGTITVFSVNEMVTDVDDVPFESAVSLKVFPNPVVNRLFTNYVSDFQVITVTGQVVKAVQNVNYIDLDGLSIGSYFVRDLRNNQTQLFIKQ